jgi:hypothetical protein
MRTGRKGVGLALGELRDFFTATYTSFESRGYFQEGLGINCTDGYQPGTVGDVELYAYRRLRRKRLFPIRERKVGLNEDEIFDLIEFLFDHASQPVDEGRYHSYSDCGYHYDQFIKGSASEEFRQEINDILKDYGSGYELSPMGEILTLPGGNLEPLLQAPGPTYDPKNIQGRVDAAVQKFRRRNASREDRRDATRDLADVLEFLKPQLQKVLAAKDERDLFEIANNFGIRHHNPKQKTNYDEPIWLSWIFYFYLATIHAATRMISKRQDKLP